MPNASKDLLLVLMRDCVGIMDMIVDHAEHIAKDTGQSLYIVIAHNIGLERDSMKERVEYQQRLIASEKGETECQRKK
jgi:hypothetical protein